MSFSINYGGFAFAVPADVVDHYIRLADGEKLKVLLFVLRHASENVTAATAAEYLRISEIQAAEALEFWEQADVLRSGTTQPGGAFAFVPQSTPVQEKTAVPEIKTEDAPLRTQRSSKEIKLDPSEIAAEIEKSPILSDLFTLAEKHIGRTLNHMEHRALLWMYQYLNIPSEIILMLIQYCVSIDKFSISYAEAIAVRWQEQGILTLDAAEEEIDRLTKAHTFTGRIRSMFELKRSPTPKQKSYIERWQNAGYPLELIRYAYEITLDNKNDLSFPYLDAILVKWEKAGVRTLEDAQAQQAQPRPKPGKAKKETPVTQETLDTMNEYLSLVNRFKEDEPNE